MQRAFETSECGRLTCLRTLRPSKVLILGQSIAKLGRETALRSGLFHPHPAGPGVLHQCLLPAGTLKGHCCPGKPWTPRSAGMWVCLPCRCLVSAPAMLPWLMCMGHQPHETWPCPQEDHSLTCGHQTLCHPNSQP